VDYIKRHPETHMTPNFVRAQQLLSLHRFDAAVEELQRHLLEQPDDGLAHAQAAICLSELKQYDRATRHAREAIGAAPEMGFSHYALAVVFYERNDLNRAADAINEAIRCDPSDVSFYRLRASVSIRREKWQDALADADEGLRLDPEDNACLNLRARCLMRLGRKQEAAATLGESLQRNPDSPTSHATQGWTLLETGRPKEALEHFREALRLNPEMDYARAGIVEALKARHLVYRLFLKYVFWMMRLRTQVRWFIVIGGFLLATQIRSLQAALPAAAPLLEVVFWSYAVFALTSWLATPLFDLLLRTSRFGRLALSRDQTHGANLFGGVGLVAAGLLLTGLITDQPQCIDVGILAALLLIPSSTVFRCSFGWPRLTMAAVTGGLALLVLARALNSSVENGELVGNLFAQASLNLFILGLIGSQLLANFLIPITPRR
jgi:tetratricopeptide (TPR) repeat protein